MKEYTLTFVTHEGVTVIDPFEASNIEEARKYSYAALTEWMEQNKHIARNPVLQNEMLIENL